MGSSPGFLTLAGLTAPCLACSCWLLALQRLGHEPLVLTPPRSVAWSCPDCRLRRTAVQVMEVFQEMVWKGCERSVITYSSLISACEKAGQWELALELFNEMHTEGCVPNTVTFNSLITACAQGA